LIEGHWLDSNGTVVIGKNLASLLGIASGDWITISATTAWDTLNANQYHVAGIVDSPMPEINDSGLFIAFPDAYELVGADGLVTELCFSAHEYAQLDAMLSASDRAAQAAQALTPTMRADSIGTLAKDYLAMRAMKGKASYFIILTVLLIAAVGIVNTILMSVFARIREIGVLKAYGMEQKSIQRLFTLEGVMVGVVGSLGGVALGSIFVGMLTRYGINVASMVGNVDMGGLPLNSTIYGVWNIPTIIAGFVFGVLVALFASGIPARMASRMEASRALRFV
ncbi:MAG TPA: FtsX-like permease family protein, partial [Spirochaetales bacterium]|nr:FtsX-like permease family protein [Spirochaetales bacterium]